MVLILQCTSNRKMSLLKFFKIDIICKNGNINLCDFVDSYSLLSTDENHSVEKVDLQIFRFDLNCNAMFQQIQKPQMVFYSLRLTKRRMSCPVYKYMDNKLIQQIICNTDRKQGLSFIVSGKAIPSIIVKR